MQNSQNSKPSKVINKSYQRNFLLIMILVVLAGTAISAATLYFNIQMPLNMKYGAVISTISDLKETLLLRSLKINLGFVLLTAAGVGLLTLLYSHRIAGPLFRIKACAKAITEGRLDTKIRLRQHDAIGSFADTINAMTHSYQDRASELAGVIQDLKNSIETHQASIHKGSDTETTLENVLDIDSKVHELLQHIKLDKMVDETKDIE